VSVGGPVVLVGGARSMGRLVGGGRSVGRWRGEDLGSGRSWWAVKSSGRRTAVGGEEQWPANCSGRRTSVVVGGGDGVSFERILKFWDESFLKMGGRKWQMRFLYFDEFSFFFFF
jgi:hypothetical protein